MAKTIFQNGNPSQGILGTIVDATFLNKLFGNEGHVHDGIDNDGHAPLFTLINKVVTLTDGATINTDASAGNIFKVTLGGNRTLAAPTNPSAGQQCTWVFTQDATGNRTITIDAIFVNRTADSIFLSTDANEVDYVTAVYNGEAAKWDVIDFTTKNKHRYAATGGSANVITATFNPPLITHLVGVLLLLNPSYDNSGAVTFNPNGVGAVAIQVGASALTSGQIKANHPCWLMYDGTVYQLLNPFVAVKSLDTRVSKSSETNYLADTDGFVSANGYFTSNGDTVLLYSDGTATPTTVVFGHDYGLAGERYSFTFPIKSGQYYNVKLTGSAVMQRYYWTPCK